MTPIEATHKRDHQIQVHLDQLGAPVFQVNLSKVSYITLRIFRNEYVKTASLNATEHSKYIPPPEVYDGPDRGSIYTVKTVEFYSESNRFTIRSDLEVPDTRIEFNESEIESETDKDRPHQKLDDSNQDPSGSKRTTLIQL